MTSMQDLEPVQVGRGEVAPEQFTAGFEALGGLREDFMGQRRRLQQELPGAAQIERQFQAGPAAQQQALRRALLEQQRTGGAVAAGGIEQLGQSLAAQRAALGGAALLAQQRGFGGLAAARAGQQAAQGLQLGQAQQEEILRRQAMLEAEGQLAELLQQERAQGLQLAAEQAGLEQQAGIFAGRLTARERQNILAQQLAAGGLSQEALLERERLAADRERIAAGLAGQERALGQQRLGAGISAGATTVAQLAPLFEQFGQSEFAL